MVYILGGWQSDFSKNWAREQKDAGEPVVDPLGVEDIRQAVGEPHEQPDAVWANDSIVVANLLRLLTAPDETPFDGFALRRQNFLKRFVWSSSLRPGPWSRT